MTYGIGERIFRTAIFQNAVANQRLERSLICSIETCRQRSCHPHFFDETRAVRGLELWQRLGAQSFVVIPRDGQARISGVSWRAADLERKIEELGGRWDRIEIFDETSNGKKVILAIIPPGKYSLDWQTLEGDMKKKFHWESKQVTTLQGENIEVIITCDAAEELLSEEFHSRVFINSNSASVSYIMLGRRAGFYLGMKQNLYFYDPRGLWQSSGIPSEGGYYNDILAVYQEVRKYYADEQIWVGGACLGCNAAVSLKINTGAPFNLILENGFADLKRDFVNNENAIASYIATSRFFWPGLFAKDISSHQKSQESGFSIETLARNVQAPLGGKIVIIRVDNDQRLPPIVHYHVMLTAQKISDDLYPIVFHSPDADPHFDRFDKYEVSKRNFLRVFNTPAQKVSLQPPIAQAHSYLRKFLVIALLAGMIIISISLHLSRYKKASKAI